MDQPETPVNKKMKGRSHKTPPTMNELNTSIPTTTPRINHMEKMKSQMVEIFQELIKPYEHKIDSLGKENSVLKTKILHLESYSRRNNLKFWGFAEKTGENKFDCKRNVLGMFKYANINIPPKVVTEVHRVGPKIPGQIRAMMVTFSYIEDRDFILAKQHHIYSACKIRVEEDFPKEITSNRKELKPILIAANKMTTEGKTKYKAALVGDNLRINNKRYTVNNMKELPHELRPAQIATQTHNGMTAFFTKDSPLSNHHLAPQTIGRTTYNCNEQYLMQQKAILFGDLETAKQIMKEREPKIQKKLGNFRNIKNYNDNTWKDRNLDIMEIGLSAKFTQNEHLKQFLLDTELNLLVEASPSDKYWGVGKSLQNPNIWIRKTWLHNSQNHLGHLLMKLRNELFPTGIEPATMYKSTLI